MLGINVEKSSLHLHFLKTLEFRTDVSVTGMPGAARATGARRFTPTTFLWGSKTQDTKQQPAQTLLLILYPSAMGPRQYDLWASNITGLCASALLRGRFLSPSSEAGSSPPPVESGCLALPSLDPRGSGPGAEPPCQSCYVLVLFHCSSFFPPFPD